MIGETLVVLVIACAFLYMVGEAILVLFFDEDEEDGKEDWWE